MTFHILMMRMVKRTGAERFRDHDMLDVGIEGCRRKRKPFSASKKKNFSMCIVARTAW